MMSKLEDASRKALLNPFMVSNYFIIRSAKPNTNPVNLQIHSFDNLLALVSDVTRTKAQENWGSFWWVSTQSRYSNSQTLLYLTSLEYQAQEGWHWLWFVPTHTISIKNDVIWECEWGFSNWLSHSPDIASFSFGKSLVKKNSNTFKYSFFIWIRRLRRIDKGRMI